MFMYITEKYRAFLSLAAVGLLVSACGAGYNHVGYKGSIPPPKFTGVKIGKPYKINGKWYYPRYDEHYDEVGIASWYGPGFHGRKTANGEIYNQWGYTAAHTTLPMPSLVRVDNLENGRSITVRINDRGPFHDGRIIDLSRAAAEKLGISGLAKVRVRFLKDETLAYIRNNGKATGQTEYSAAARAGYVKHFDVQNSQKVKGGYNNNYAKVASPLPKLLKHNNNPVVDAAPLLSVAVKSLPPLVRDANAADSATKTTTEPKSQVDSGYSGLSWAIQVASFMRRENAEHMMQKLVNIGQPQLKPVVIDGRRWFRVLLHPGGKYKSQSQLLSYIRNMGLGDARLVRP